MILVQPGGRPTTFQALVMTRGLWKRNTLITGESICHVCGRSIMHWDHARMSHLRGHLNTGWRPAPPGAAPSVVEGGAE